MLNTTVDMRVLEDFVNTEFGVSVEYKEDGVFEVSEEDAKKLIGSIDEQDINGLHKAITEGWHEIQKLKIINKEGDDQFRSNYA